MYFIPETYWNLSSISFSQNEKHAKIYKTRPSTCQRPESKRICLLPSKNKQTLVSFGRRSGRNKPFPLNCLHFSTVRKRETRKGFFFFPSSSRLLSHNLSPHKHLGGGAKGKEEGKGWEVGKSVSFPLFTWWWWRPLTAVKLSLFFSRA